MNKTTEKALIDAVVFLLKLMLQNLGFQPNIDECIEHLEALEAESIIPPPRHVPKEARKG